MSDELQFDSVNVQVTLSHEGQILLHAGLTDLILQAIPTGRYILTDMSAHNAADPETGERISVRARLSVEIIPADEPQPNGDWQLVGLGFQPPPHPLIELFSELDRLAAGSVQRTPESLPLSAWLDRMGAPWAEGNGS